MPTQIGFQHGTNASHLIQGSIQFYTGMFLQWSNMDWDAATAAASQFEPYLTAQVPHLVEEMRGKAWLDFTNTNQPNIVNAHACRYR